MPLIVVSPSRLPSCRWGYVCEEINDYPEYIPNMGVEGESKPGSTPGENVKTPGRYMHTCKRVDFLF